MRPATAAALGAAAVAGSFAAMRSSRVAQLEAAIARHLRRPRGPVADGIVTATTDLGSVFAVAGAATVLASRGRARPAASLSAGGMLAWGVAQALKPLVDRRRPFEAVADEPLVQRLVAVPAGSAWPSGHPAVAAGAVVALGAWLPRGARAAGAAVAGYVALSRVYVGVHHPTDVVAGLGVGAVCGAGVAAVVRRR